MAAIVLDACELRSIAANRFRQLVEVDSRVALWASRALVHEARRHAIAVAKFGAGAEVRLHLHLAELLTLGATKLPDGAMRMTATPNQVEVAQAIGVTREYVSELLSRDEAHGTIRRSNGRLVIPSSSVILTLLEDYRMYEREHFDAC
jgi:CRP-like cAMP-binding protein